MSSCPSMRLINKLTREQWVQWLLLCFVVVAVMWRGGKSIDVTWVLTGIAGAVVFSSFLSLKEKASDRMPAFLWVAVMSFLVLTVVSYFYSSAKNYGFDEVIRTGSLLLLFLWAVRKAQDSVDLRENETCTHFIRVLSIATLTACGIGLVVYTFQPVNRFVGTFFDFRFHTDYWPNAWANYLLLTWPIVAEWVFRNPIESNTKSQYSVNIIIRSLILGFVIGCLFLSFSRGAIIAFVGQIILLSGILYIKKLDKTEWKRKAIKVGMIFVVSLLVFQFANILRSDVHQVLSVGKKITFSADEGVSSVSERSEFWKQSISLIKEEPLLGWGPYSFRFIQPHSQTQVLATSDHPHNVFLKIAVERGVIASLILLILLGLILYKGIYSEVRKESQSNNSLNILIIVSLAGVISHSLIDYNLQFVGIALPFWLLVGFLSGSLFNDSKFVVHRKISVSLEVILVSILLFAALFEGVYLVTSSLGRHAEARGEERIAMRWYQRSSNEWFSRDLHLSRSKILFSQGNLTEAERADRQYIKLNKSDYRSWKLLGEIYEEMGVDDKAVSSYETAYQYGVYNDLGILHGLVRSYLAWNRAEEIDARREEFDSIISDFANAFTYNTHFVSLSPNVEEFVSLCELFARLYPEDAPSYFVLAARADHYAGVERDRIDARPPGFLW